MKQFNLKKQRAINKIAGENGLIILAIVASIFVPVVNTLIREFIDPPRAETGLPTSSPTLRRFTLTPEAIGTRSPGEKR